RHGRRGDSSPETKQRSPELAPPVHHGHPPEYYPASESSNWLGGATQAVLVCRPEMGSGGAKARCLRSRRPSERPPRAQSFWASESRCLVRGASLAERGVAASYPRLSRLTIPKL